MRVGLVVSCVVHAAILGVGLLAYSDAEPFTVEPVEALPVELVRLAEKTDLRVGDRKAEPEAPPQPKPVVKAPAPEPEVAEIPAETPIKAAREPAPRPVRDVTKQPKPAEAEAVAEAPPDEPKQVAAIPKPIPAAVETAPEEAEAPQLPALAPTPPRARPKPPKTIVAQKPAEPEEKPEPKKVEPPPEEAFDPDDIAALLNKQEDRGGGDPEPAAEPQSVGASEGRAEAPMTMSELAALQSRLAGCWNPPIGVREAGNLVVTIGIYLAPDGQLSASPRIVSAGGDYLSQVAAESAIRAVQICAPYDFLPPDKYTQWREINFNFNPREMLGG